jgi:hypothetical protein
MNGERTARLVALIAGNGFILSKLAEYWLPEGRHFQFRTIAVIIAALLGVSFAYIATWTFR